VFRPLIRSGEGDPSAMPDYRRPERKSMIVSTLTDIEQLLAEIAAAASDAKRRAELHDRLIIVHALRAIAANPMYAKTTVLD
jgi:hypothetical protein